MRLQENTEAVLSTTLNEVSKVQILDVANELPSVFFS